MKPFSKIEEILPWKVFWQSALPYILQCHLSIVKPFKFGSIIGGPVVSEEIPTIRIVNS